MMLVDNSLLRTVHLTVNLRDKAEQAGSVHFSDRNVIDLARERFPIGVTDPIKLVIPTDLVEGHPLKKYIQQLSLLTPADFHRILCELDLPIPMYKSGAISASHNDATDYSSHGWTRDAAITSMGFWASGNMHEALRANYNLNQFYNQPGQRNRLVAFHFHDDPVGLYKADPTKYCPHIRARINHEGRWVESDQLWRHDQIDAIGMWLWTTFFFASQQGPSFFLGLNNNLTKKINPDNGIDPIQSAAIRFLSRINYWNQIDTSMWEDWALPQRGSSIAFCLAAFKKAQSYFDMYRELGLKLPQGFGGKELKHEIEEGIHFGNEALGKRVPLNGAYAIETETFPSDLALVLTLYPFNPGYTRAQEDAILRMYYKDRMCAYGSTRRDSDNFLGTDYAYRQHGEGIWADPTRDDFRPAEWTLGDPVLAAFLYDRFVRDGDINDLFLADRHAKRCLAQFTKEVESFHRVVPNVAVSIPKLRLPEARWWDTQQQRMRPNHNTPLFMAESYFMMMVERAIAAHAKLSELKSVA